MPQAGVLGALERFDARTHKTVLSLGCCFGQFESWLQNKNVPDGEIDKKCAELAYDINEDLEGLNSGYRITMDTKSKRRLRQEAFNEIEKTTSLQSASHGVYFMIGTALGLLYHGMEELAATRLKGIGEYHEMMKVESEDLFKHLRDTTIPLNGRSSEALVTDVIIMLQRLLRDIVILFVTSDPRNAPRLFINEEHAALRQVLESTSHGANYKVEMKTSCEPDNLQQDIIRFRPQIIHFAGHAGNEGLCFQDKNQQIKLVMATKLAGILEMAVADGLRVVVLNACCTSSQCDGIASKVESVIAMRGLVGDEEAVSFSRSFYYALGMGKPVANAFNSALASCSLMDRPELIRPILIQNGQQGDVKTSDTPSTSLAVTSDAQAPVLADDSLDGHTLIDESVDGSVDGAQQNVSDSEVVVICGDTVENGEGGKVEETEIIDLNSENMTTPEISVTTELNPVPESDKNEVTNDKDEGQGSPSSEGTTGDEDEKEDSAASGTEGVQKDTEGKDEPSSDGPPTPSTDTPPKSPPQNTALTSRPNAAATKPPSESPAPSTTADTPPPGSRPAPAHPPKNITEASLRRLCQDQNVRRIARIFREDRTEGKRIFIEAFQGLRIEKPQLVRELLELPENILRAILLGRPFQVTLQQPARQPVPPSQFRQPAAQPRPARSPFDNIFEEFLHLGSLSANRPPFGNSPFDEFFQNPRIRGPGLPAQQGRGQQQRAPPAEPARQGMRTVESIECNVCGERFAATGGFHCTICKGGDFDVCSTCVGNNVGCLNRNHVLRKWNVVAG